MATINNIKLASLKIENEYLYFYFQGWNSLDLFKTLPSNLKFNNISFMASDYQNYIYNSDIKLDSINDCLQYFTKNSNFSIDNFDAELENNIYIGSHDDGEIHLKIPYYIDYKPIINNLLQLYDFDSEKIIKNLFENENLFLKIESPNIIEKIYNNFEEYCNEN